MMRRREFITLIGGAAAWPLTAHAQQPVIGYLGMTSPEAYASRLLAFRQGLSETGYLEGRNVTIEYRWAESQFDRLPQLASELVSLRPSAIVTAGSTAAALAAKAATTAIPIVFEIGGDPFAAGVVSGLSRPGSNVTGVTSLNVEINPKRLELLHELIPNVKTVALLVNPADRTVTEPVLPQMQAAARTLGLELHILQASAERDIEPVFARLAELGAGGLCCRVRAVLRQPRGTTSNARASPSRSHALLYAGICRCRRLGELWWESDESHRLSGQYVGRILKGEKPGDLPVQQVTRVELIINLKTALALGIDVPRQLIARADEVIE